MYNSVKCDVKFCVHAVTRMLTFVLVDPDDDDALVASDPDQLVDGADTPARQLTQQDHALDVVVLQQVDVRAHLRD